MSLNAEFIKIAKKTKNTWNQINYNPYSLWGKGYDWDHSSFILRETNTHCGTAELEGVEATKRDGGSPESIVSAIAHQAAVGEVGNFVYYCPKAPRYLRATAKLKKIGFEKVNEFQHLGFLKRKPDYGWAEMWVLSLTHDDAQYLRAIGEVEPSDPDEDDEDF